jgi:hypothetical protein
MPGPSRPIEFLAQDHTERAVNVLAEIMDDPFEEAKDRIKAADAILDRGHGKPVAVSIALPSGRRAAQLASYSDDDLIAIIEQHELPRIADQRPKTAKDRLGLVRDAIDAEFVPAGHNADPTDEELLE